VGRTHARTHGNYRTKYRNLILAILLAGCGSEEPAAARVAALTGADEATSGGRGEGLRPYEVTRLDETESLHSASERGRARADLLDQLLRERLEEEGLLERVERDPAGTSALVEETIRGIREEFDETTNPSDLAELDLLMSEDAARWEPSAGDTEALEAALDLSRRERIPRPEGVGSYGVDAELERHALVDARRRERGGAR